MVGRVGYWRVFDGRGGVYKKREKAKKAPPKIRIQTFISICSKEPQKNIKKSRFHHDALTRSLL